MRPEHCVAGISHISEEGFRVGESEARDYNMCMYSSATVAGRLRNWLRALCEISESSYSHHDTGFTDKGAA